MSATAEVRIEQDELDAIKRSVLTSSRRLLVDSLDPANHLTYLRSKFVFTERDAEEITAPASRSARAEVFLDKLSLKGSEAYDEFQNSLCRDKTQLFLLTSMTKTLELLKHKVREFKGHQMKQHMEQHRWQLERQKMQPPPPPHTVYQTHGHQKAGHSPPPRSGCSPRPQQQRIPFTAAQQQRQQPTSYRPTVAQQAQREAYCQQRLAELGSSHAQRQQQQQPPTQPHAYMSMGFSPPPRYQTHAFTPSQTPPPHNHHHLRHMPPRQAPPNFQSRDPSDRPPATSDEIETHALPNGFLTEGLSPDITSPPDMPSGQPTC